MSWRHRSQSNRGRVPDETMNVPYLCDIYSKHGWDALISHLSQQLTTERMRILCTALGLGGRCTQSDIAKAIAQLVAGKELR